MKKVILVFSLLMFFFCVGAQEIAVKTKAFCWGNSESFFYQQLTESGKKMLDSSFTIVKFDSVDCVRLTFDNELQYINKGYLRNHRYQYLTMYTQNGVILTRTYNNDLIPSSNQRKKVLLKYSKDNNNQNEKITLYVIE
jgi:hypothetical protein